jgi:hypothetical protein
VSRAAENRNGTWCLHFGAAALLVGSCAPASDSPSATSDSAASNVSVPATDGPSARGLGHVGDRAAHTASSLPDGRIFVAGGCITDGCATATSDTFLVDAAGTTAVAGPSLLTQRDGHTANVIADGRIMLVGGYPGEGAGVLSSIEIVDADMTISQHTLDHARGGHASANVAGDRVLVVGGWIGPRTYTATAELIGASGIVTQLPDLPWAADALDAVTLQDGRVLVTGGQVEAGVPTAQAAIYDPTNDLWLSIPPMHTARLKHLSVVLDDGRVLVMGGDVGNDATTAGTELFDPATLTFTDGPDLSEPRYKFPGGALVLDDGRVLVAGGGRTVEIVDVAAGTTSVIRETERVGSFATLSRLGSGDFIVIGGYDDRINLRRTATIIDGSIIGG